MTPKGPTMTDSAAKWIEQVRHESIDRLESIQRMQDELAGIHGEAVAARGLVWVRVSAAGMAMGLDLDPEAMRLGAGELSAAILSALGEATARAGERVRAVVGQVVPAEELAALMRGTVTDTDRHEVEAQLVALKHEEGAQVEGPGAGSRG